MRKRKNDRHLWQAVDLVEFASVSSEVNFLVFFEMLHLDEALRTLLACELFVARVDQHVALDAVRTSE